MAPADPAPTRLTVDEYYGLVEQGQLSPDDRVELLEGVVVSMPPQGPRHGGAIGRINELLVRTFQGRALVRVQCDFLAGPYSVPEPDFAVVPGGPDEYDTRHPDRAHLIVEVSVTSLPSDRISKARLYAAAGVPQYLIVNVPGDCVEVFEQPAPPLARYGRAGVARRGERIPLVDFPDVALAVDDLLAPPATG